MFDGFEGERVTLEAMQAPMKRPGLPAGLQAVDVLPASNHASYSSGATLPVTGGVFFI